MAVILMIEGHTVDVLLSDNYRISESVFYQFWITVRGFTAPFFMITAGSVYTFLLYGNGKSINKIRLAKGFRRGLSLIIIGYLLRFPSYNPVKLMNISESQWNVFSSVDALHIIGLGLIIINIIALIQQKTAINKYLLFIILSIIFWSGLVFNPLISSYNFHFMVKAYFTNQTGTIFTLFPWVGFLTFGSILGFLVKDGYFKFNKTIIEISFLTLLLYGINILVLKYYPNYNYEFYLIVQRVSFVLIVFSSIFFLTKNKTIKLTQIIILGRKSLLIYVVHLFLLYGSPISLGFYQLFPHSLSLINTVLSVLVMEAAMILLAVFIENKLSRTHLKEYYGKIYKYKSEFKLRRKRF